MLIRPLLGGVLMGNLVVWIKAHLPLSNCHLWNDCISVVQIASLGPSLLFIPPPLQLKLNAWPLTHDPIRASKQNSRFTSSPMMVTITNWFPWALQMHRQNHEWYPILSMNDIWRIVNVKFGHQIQGKWFRNYKNNKMLLLYKLV